MPTILPPNCCTECQGTGWTSDEEFQRVADACDEQGVELDPFSGDCKACGGTGSTKEIR